tara:strand:- start:428 stop:916 length:489 start_codon:yes stop_codon:yes gene_type:complete
MAYRIVGIDDAFGVNEIGLGADFSFNNPAIFRTVYTTNQIHTARLKTLILTRKGERLLQPTYGTNLLDILFEPNVVELTQDIIEILEGAINFWLPDLQVENINVVTNETDPTLVHQIQITIEYSSDDLQANAITVSLTETGNIQVEDVDVGTQTGNPSFGVA